MTNARLADDFSVISGHFEELGDGLTLIAFLSLVDSDETFSLFLLECFALQTAAARQWTNKFVRCSRLRRLSPTIKKRRLKGTYVSECFSVID